MLMRRRNETSGLGAVIRMPGRERDQYRDFRRRNCSQILARILFVKSPTKGLTVLDSPFRPLRPVASCRNPVFRNTPTPVFAEFDERFVDTFFRDIDGSDRDTGPRHDYEILVRRRVLQRFQPQDRAFLLRLPAAVRITARASTNPVAPCAWAGLKPKIPVRKDLRALPTEGLFYDTSDTIHHDDSRQTSLADHLGESPGGRTTLDSDCETQEDYSVWVLRSG
jgi:hypothetical protein